MEQRLEWNNKRKLCVVEAGKHALLWVREKGIQANTCGEEMNAGEGEVEQKQTNSNIG